MKEKDCQYINLKNQESKLELENKQLHNAVSGQVKMRENVQRERNKLIKENNELTKINNELVQVHSELMIKINGGFINGGKEPIQNHKNN